MSAERIYRLLLRAYPQAFRAEFGSQMALLFRDQCREGDVRSVGFWVTVIADVARSAPALRLEEWRENTRTMEVIMKLAAMLPLLLGALGILNAGVEWGASQASTISGAHGLSLMLGVFASALLLAAGVAIMRGTPQGRNAARLALIGSLVMFVSARLLFPWMGILAQLIGLGSPVVLLIALYWPRGASPAGAA